jgi:hypothetical protein
MSPSDHTISAPLTAVGAAVEAAAPATSARTAHRGAQRLRWRPIMTSLVAVVVGLAGCTPSDTTPDTTPSPTTAGTEGPPATPTATDTAGSDWLISAAGIGPYHLNAEYSFEAGARHLTDYCAFTVMSDSTHGDIALYDQDHAVWEPTQPVPVLRATMVMTNASTTAPADPPQTAEGIGPGSTRAEVAAAYPDAAPGATGQAGDSLVVQRDGVPILFQFANGVDSPQLDTDTVAMVLVGADGVPKDFCG